MKKYKIKLIIVSASILVYILYLNVSGEVKELPIPVKNATAANWDRNSYWYYPINHSTLHLGIDIFSPQKTPVFSPVNGIVLSTGFSNNGGKYIYIIGPKSRIYYFAHLNSIDIERFNLIKKLQQIGTVGNTGNAIDKPYHLHFSIFSIFPLINNFDRKAPQGWKKMFYLNPEKSIIF
ncbi:M23 family metallopeptidase [Mucilaginibacter sp. AW1-3]